MDKFAGEIAVFWFRRDLRLDDNTGLTAALKTGLPVLPVFIFDTNITVELPVNDPRITFIYKSVLNINQQMAQYGSSLLILQGDPLKVFTDISKLYNIRKLFFNRDYEPYALDRDKKINTFFEAEGTEVFSFRDQVIFEPGEIIKDNGEPYTVYTPFKNKWLSKYYSKGAALNPPVDFNGLLKINFKFPELKELGFTFSGISVKDFDLSVIDNYSETRNLPHLDSTSYLSPHLRFGTIGPRQVIARLQKKHETFLSELVWREFFMQILFFFPKVVNSNFKAKYDGIQWRNNEDDFQKWCRGETGYPMVDAGMRQLNSTGYMHNRVRMITASFLCKHLLINWQRGEAYFAGKLLDFELSSNNGNWQWAAGTGCDAAPYFRVFNPEEQRKKFDNNYEYIRKWIPEYGTPEYPSPMIDHSFARKRALETYKKGLKS